MRRKFMLKTRLVMALVCCGMAATGLRADEVQMIEAGQIAAHDLAPGPAREVLPASGALIHLQVHDVMSVLEGMEEIVVSGVPEKLLPSDLQDLFRSEHPLLTMLGYQAFQQPLTPEVFEQFSGLDPRGTATLTLYLGDFRRMFILSLPAGSRESLARTLTTALRPSLVEEVNLSGKAALRVVSPAVPYVPEWYLVASEETVYLCGDRSLAIALYNTPAAERMGQDAFMARELPAVEDQQIRLVLNPASIKPFAMQLQGLTGIANMLIPQQRQRLLADLPAEAREQLEIQVQSQLGLRDLDQFADYAECVVLASLEQFTDFITSNAASFEGVTVTANLKAKFEQISFKLHSQKFEAGHGTAPIPIGEIRKALAWLGPDFQSFSVTGRTPAPKDLPVLSAWVQRVRAKCEARGLQSACLGRLAKLLEDRSPVPTLESRAPWTLTVNAPLRPLPSIEDAPSLEDYFASLDLPVRRPVWVIPGKDKSYLESFFQAETEALNRNQQLVVDFFGTFRKQRPLLSQVNRFDATELDQGVTRYVRESAWITRGGLFGYDQHELINRKIIWARQLDDYLVYHRGAMSSAWLAELKGNKPGEIVTGVRRLLDRVPQDASTISVNRVLAGLPDVVEWLGGLEARLHKDARNYLAEVQSIVDSNPDLDQARRKIKGMQMPLMIGSVNLNPATGKVYGLLPTGDAALTLPRAPLIPLVRNLLAGYAEKADELGGSVTYTRNGGGSSEFTMMQSWEAVATLTRTLGNSIADEYLSSPQRQQVLQEKLTNPRDMDSSVFDEVIARNPNWRFIPQPQPKTEARPTKAIPQRSPNAGPNQVDLTDYYNALLDECWHQGGLENNTLKDIPCGLQQFGGITFDVRGIVQLSGQQATSALRVKFPQEVEGIAVGRAGARLHFLHACGWQSPRGTTIGEYRVHYRNGETREVPIVYGSAVQDWWLSEPVAEDSGLNVIWRGENHATTDGPAVGVYLTTWENPLPEQEIVSIDYHSTMANSAPFLLAITLD